MSVVSSEHITMPSLPSHSLIKRNRRNVTTRRCDMPWFQAQRLCSWWELSENLKIHGSDQSNWRSSPLLGHSHHRLFRVIWGMTRDCLMLAWCQPERYQNLICTFEGVRGTWLKGVPCGLHLAKKTSFHRSLELSAPPSAWLNVSAAIPWALHFSGWWCTLLKLTSLPASNRRHLLTGSWILSTMTSVNLTRVDLEAEIRSFIQAADDTFVVNCAVG